MKTLIFVVAMLLTNSVFAIDAYVGGQRLRIPDISLREDVTPGSQFTIYTEDGQAYYVAVDSILQYSVLGDPSRARITDLQTGHKYVIDLDY